MRLLGRLKLPRREREVTIPHEPVTYTPIGGVRSKWRDLTSQPDRAGKADIVLHEDFLPALESIEGFTHLIVLFHMDRVPAEESRQSVAVEEAERGVLATRSQLRPNPIGVSVVQLVKREGNVLSVRGLDALNGTPVLDIKPYLPPYDSVPQAGLPDWATH